MPRGEKNQKHPSVAVNGRGKYVVVWTEVQIDGVTLRVRSVRRVAEEVEVGTATRSTPEIAAAVRSATPPPSCRNVAGAFPHHHVNMTPR